MAEHADKSSDKQSEMSVERKLPSLNEDKDQCESPNQKNECGRSRRIYKKSSMNCELTVFLVSREFVLAGSSPALLRGVAFVDPKAVRGKRIFAQLSLTFRYGRDDEEVLGLRFCNEVIMSLHQVWPCTGCPNQCTLCPLQEMLVRRLGSDAHPFILTLTSLAPPSVQLVPAKRYCGAPIGTSYNVHCFIADQPNERNRRRAPVKMGVRVIYRSDVVRPASGPENFSPLAGQATPMPISPPSAGGTASASEPTSTSHTAPAGGGVGGSSPKSRKSRLSSKSFRLGRSKSNSETDEPFHNYSKLFQEYDYGSSGGPQGAVDKPFLLQDGRVALRAGLDKAWYQHGEKVCVAVNIRNDSRKTVRKVRVSAVQLVDVCMFSNGKFKNVVADSDTGYPVGYTVPPGGILHETIVLQPQRGRTKHWIALEDTLQHSSEPEQNTGVIAASAMRSPNTHNFGIGYHHLVSGTGRDRNIFAIYVSYYVKVKLTLSGIGGKLSLKLPFVVAHIDEQQRTIIDDLMNKLALDSKPAEQRTEGKDKVAMVAGSPAVLADAEDVEHNGAPVPVSAMMQNEPTNKGANKRQLRRSKTFNNHLNEVLNEQPAIAHDKNKDNDKMTTTDLADLGELKSQSPRTDRHSSVKFQWE